MWKMAAYFLIMYVMEARQNLMSQVFMIGQLQGSEKGEMSAFYCKGGKVGISNSYVGHYASGGELYGCFTQISSTSFSEFPGGKYYEPDLEHSDALFVEGMGERCKNKREEGGEERGLVWGAVTSLRKLQVELWRWKIQF
jgi:hypothetical protein